MIKVCLTFSKINPIDFLHFKSLKAWLNKGLSKESKILSILAYIGLFFRRILN